MSAPITLFSLSADWWSAISTAVGAIGTLSAVIVALWLARRQTNENRLKERRGQAEKVTAWLDYDAPVAQNDTYKRFVGLVVRNASDQLVYEMVAQVVRSGKSDGNVVRTGDQARDFGAMIGSARPGETKSRINDGGGGMHAQYAVEISFRDASGNYWIRYGDGQLVETFDEPLDRYKIDRPVTWENT